MRLQYVCLERQRGCSVDIYYITSLTHPYAFIGGKWAMSSYVVLFLKIELHIHRFQCYTTAYNCVFAAAKGVQEGELVVS